MSEYRRRTRSPALLDLYNPFEIPDTDLAKAPSSIKILKLNQGCDLSPKVEGVSSLCGTVTSRSHTISGISSQSTE